MALPQMSRPIKANGIQAACTGVGLWYPMVLHAFTNFFDKSNSEKVMASNSKLSISLFYFLIKKLKKCIYIAS